MPPASSPGLHGDSSAGSTFGVRPQRLAEDRAAKVRFRRAITLMLMTLVVPGSAQVVAGNRRVGWNAIWTWLALIVIGSLTLLVAALSHTFALKLVLSPFWLGLFRTLLIALAIGWAALIVDAWRIGQPLTLRQNHRLAVVGLNGVLCFSVAGTLLFGAHLVTVQRDFIITMFGDGTTTAAHDGRYNVLLLGGDSGAGRWGLRPDSMTIASIDAETGKTVLFGLPRNMENFPFAKGSVMAEQFPDGFDCDGCYLNGVSTWAGDNTELFKHRKTAGTDATIMAVEGITGLKINYWAMVNLEGFKDLVDAVGGVTLNVRQPIPVGGLGDKVTGYIDPGVRKLNGHDTLWYARARDGSDDYSRMARQKCVMSAMLNQIDPKTMVTNFQSIAKATTGMVQTDLPAGDLGRFMQLALKAKSQKVATVSFVPPMINTADPDIKLIKKTVKDAIDRAEGSSETPGKAKKKKHAQVTGGSLGTRDSGYTANSSDDLGAAC
ncbi:LCP family protein [Nocardioides sp.]|uniref:LCP family protein n=1 Tax=Nocardioides sp. TaxID=35761 RepID=UPI003D149217